MNGSGNIMIGKVELLLSRRKSQCHVHWHTREVYKHDLIGQKGHREERKRPVGCFCLFSFLHFPVMIYFFYNSLHYHGGMYTNMVVLFNRDRGTVRKRNVILANTKTTLSGSNLCKKKWLSPTSTNNGNAITSPFSLTTTLQGNGKGKSFSMKKGKLFEHSGVTPKKPSWKCVHCTHIQK